MVQQKLGMDLFKKLNTQLKSGGVHIVSSDGKDLPDRQVTQENVICKIQQVFNLGKKMEVITQDDRCFKNDQLRFQQFQDVFYLVRK
jgi:hypothetical protein